MTTLRVLRYKKILVETQWQIMKIETVLER